MTCDICDRRTVTRAVEHPSDDEPMRLCAACVRYLENLSGWSFTLSPGRTTSDPD